MKDKVNISDFDHMTPDVKNSYFNAATQLKSAKHEMDEIYGSDAELRRLSDIKNATEDWVKYHEREANVLRRVIRAVNVRISAFKAVEKSRKCIDTMDNEFNPDIHVVAYGAEPEYW